MDSAVKDVTIKADQTAADGSPDAAGGGELQTRFLGFQTPGSTSSEHAIPLTSIFDGEDFLEPPEDPIQMYKAFQLSAYWEPIVEALLTNVYKQSYILRPVIPFDRPLEAKRLIKEALIWQQSSGDFNADIAITDEEVEDLLNKLQQRSIIEKHFVDKFFQEAIPDMTYRQLWDLTGQDLEIEGNAYWEVIRDTEGKIARIQWLPAITMKATKQGAEQVGCEKIVRDSILSWKPEPQIRRFRRYAQVHGSHVVTYFKEFGDPRVLSRKTGKFYTDIMHPETGEVLVTGYQRLVKAEQAPDNPMPLPATEAYHWKLAFGGSTVYGKSRGSGIHPSLRGARDLDEENLKLINDEAIPSLMLLVSGGVVGAKAFDRLRAQIAERKKGRKGILLVEAVSGAQVGVAHPQQQPKIAVERMKSQQSSDAIFQNYEKRTEEKAAGAYRMPQSGLGKNVGANRATYQAQQRFTEDQVYAPKREDRDELMQLDFFAELDIITWRYETRAQMTKDPKTIAEVLRILIEAGVITPNEAREEAGPIFNKRLDDLKGLWTMFPPRVLTVMLQTKNQELATALLGEDEVALDKLVQGIRGMLGLGSMEQQTVKEGDKVSGQPTRRPDPESGGAGPIPETEGL